MGAATRFSGLSPLLARAVLAAIALVLILSAALYSAQPAVSPANSPEASNNAGADAWTMDARGQRDVDLALYDAITARVARGEDYHQVAIEEQRARNFPVRPGLAVRLPTLAIASAVIGQNGVMLAGLILALVTFFVWWGRLGTVVENRARQIIALGLLGIGVAVGFKPTYFVLHEVWAGMLIALALALHRPNRWIGAWIAAALALSIREHALPFVLLMGTLAAWRREWREALAWAALVIMFAAAVLWHLSIVSQIVNESDPLSPSWLALRGISGWAGNIVLCSGLYLLPPWLAAPLVFVPLIGWAGLNDRLGLEASLLLAGYGVMFALIGRDNNFYWGLMVTPAWFVGTYWVPAALRDLWRRAANKALTA